MFHYLDRASFSYINTQVSSVLGSFSRLQASLVLHFFCISYSSCFFFSNFPVFFYRERHILNYHILSLSLLPLFFIKETFPLHLFQFFSLPLSLKLLYAAFQFATTKLSPVAKSFPPKVLTPLPLKFPSPPPPISSLIILVVTNTAVK